MRQPYDPRFEPTSAERVARNDAVFRAANDEIADSAARDADRHTIPVICECAQPDCREILRVAVEDYEAVRRHPARFINAPDHDVAARDWARVVSERDGYVVVEKVGEAKEVAEELAGGDTRAEPAGT